MEANFRHLRVSENRHFQGSEYMTVFEGQSYKDRGPGGFQKVGVATVYLQGAAQGNLLEGEPGVTVIHRGAYQTAQCGIVHVTHINYTSTAV